MAYGTLAADNIQSSSTGTTPPKFLNNSGTELGQLCKAWVNFNGTSAGTITPRANFNVSSVTKNGAGDWTLNFTNALGDANYSVGGQLSVNAATGGSILSILESTPPTTTAVRVINSGSTTIDRTYVTAAVFGN